MGAVVPNFSVRRVGDRLAFLQNSRFGGTSFQASDEVVGFHQAHLRSCHNRCAGDVGVTITLSSVGSG